MEGWLNQMARFLHLWMIRIAVLSSFAAHLVLILLAGIRRHKASGGRTLLLWLAYQLANWAATYALGNLSFGCKSQEQQQLVAFWAPFLLQHLGGPDNISAYSLEDNVLSGRQALNVLVQVGEPSMSCTSTYTLVLALATGFCFRHPSSFSLSALPSMWRRRWRYDEAIWATSGAQARRGGSN